MRFFSVFQNQIRDRLPEEHKRQAASYEPEELEAPEEKGISATERAERMAQLKADLGVPSVSEVLKDIHVDEIAAPDILLAHRNTWAEMMSGLQREEVLSEFLHTSVAERYGHLGAFLKEAFPEESYMMIKSGMKVRPFEGVTQKLTRPDSVNPYFLSYREGTYLIGDTRSKEYAVTQDSRIAAALVYMGYAMDDLGAMWQRFSWNGPEPAFVNKGLQKKWNAVKQYAAEEDSVYIQAFDRLTQQAGLTPQSAFAHLQNIFMGNVGFEPDKYRIVEEKIPEEPVKKEVPRASQNLTLKQYLIAFATTYAILGAGLAGYKVHEALTTDKTPPATQSVDVAKPKPAKPKLPPKLQKEM